MMLAALAEPTEAQKEAGNYAKHHVSVHGLPITIENLKGSTRSGTGGDGKPWSVTMPAHYGYFKRSEGADGDHVDCYIGPHTKSPFVLVVDQVDAASKRFDEHKCMLGFANKAQALAFYKRGFSDGKGGARVGHATEMTIDEFKDWLKNGDTTKTLKRASGGRIPELADGGTFDPDAYLGAAPPAGGFDPDAYLKVAPASPPNPFSQTPKEFGKQFVSAVTDVPHEIYEAGKSALSTIGSKLNPLSDERRAAMLRGDVIGPFLETGRGMLAIPEAIGSPITGAARSLIGHPYSAITGIPYDKAKEAVDTAMMGLAPRGGLRPASVPTPTPPVSNGPLGVTLSEGQKTGELPLIQREQSALRGASGDAAQARAQEFADQQRGQVQSATERAAQGFDPFNQVVAETPQQAGQLVSEGVQSAARQRKAGVTAAYEEAKALPGEIHAGAFEGIGPKIKADLSLRDDPIIIDDKLTPFASRAVQDIENRVANLNIQNRADPFSAKSGMPSQVTKEQAVGINLQGVDQMRRRLSSFRNDAYASGNAADGRAARAVLQAFDDHVDSAVNGGLFTGDQRAIKAWNDARAANADYRSTFSAGKNDPVGRVVEKILGKGNNPAAIPNDVADFMYGGSGVNPGTLNVNVAKRIRDILGEQSPEWSAVKQGLFSRIVDPGVGVTDWGPGKIAQRVNKFLNVDGLELAKEIYSPGERHLIQQYGDLQRQLQVPQAGANWSNTSTVLAPMLKKISGGVAALVGGIVGHTIAPGLYGMGEAAGAAAASRVAKMVSEQRNLRRVAAQMPLLAEQTLAYQRALASANRANSPLTQTALRIATTNLTRGLSQIGLDPVAVFRGAQGAAPSGANQQQQ